MKKLRQPALIETNATTGDVRLCLRGQNLVGTNNWVMLDGYTGTPRPEEQPLTTGQWELLSRACAERGGFKPAEVRGPGVNARESAAMALAHHGYATMYRALIKGSCVAWAIVPTQAGREALHNHLTAFESGSRDADSPTTVALVSGAVGDPVRGREPADPDCP